MAGIVIKPRAGILHGHDWVFFSEAFVIPSGAAEPLKKAKLRCLDFAWDDTAVGHG